MTLIRRLAYAALGFAFFHIVFGAIVRISGSGMGCGDNWPKCYGYWFPPFSRMDLVIEVMHRYFAAGLTTTIIALFIVAFLRRDEEGVAGRGGVLRSSGLAVGLVVFAAAFGAVTVFLGNTPLATVAHKAIAATLLAVLAVTVIRAGGLGGRTALAGGGSSRAARGAMAAAGLAITIVLLGALTAKLPGAAVACKGFPLCGDGSLGGGAQHVQLTHRVLAYLLTFHLMGLAIGFTRRAESPVVRLASRVALGVIALQIVLGAMMVLGNLPPVLRSLHQATGVSLWLTAFTMAYLARIAAGKSALEPTGSGHVLNGDAPLGAAALGSAKR